MPVSLQPPDQSVTPQERRIRDQIVAMQTYLNGVVLVASGMILGTRINDPAPTWLWVGALVAGIGLVILGTIIRPPSMPKLGQPGASFEIKPKQHKVQVGDDRQQPVPQPQQYTDDDGNTRTRVDHPDGSVTWSSSGRARQVSGPGVDDDWKDARS